MYKRQAQADAHDESFLHHRRIEGKQERADHSENAGQDQRCLLYTSDAADERSSVDLGGRRIIKKKK